LFIDIDHIEEQSMSKLSADPLLRGTKFLLRVAQVISLIAGIGIAIAAPMIWFFRDKILAELAKEADRLFGVEALWAITFIMAGCLVIVALAFLFLRHLIALIDTVDAGSPFIPDNAVRLRTMGWLVLAMEGMALLALPFAAWLQRALPDGDVEFSVDFGGIITALLLFILARVFERGIRLEQDVEGTV
jgi:hypothetical protein